MLSIIYHYFEYKPMGLYSRGLIFECFFCQRIIGLILEGAYNRGGLHSRFYGIYDTLYTKCICRIRFCVPHVLQRFSLIRIVRIWNPSMRLGVVCINIALWDQFSKYNILNTTSQYKGVEFCICIYCFFPVPFWNPTHCTVISLPK